LLTDLCTAFLPGTPQLQLQTIAIDAQRITLEVSSIQVAPTCPDCGQTTHRVHSRYVRTLADLPWPELAARIQLHVRRFFCDEPACSRRTFSERLPTLVAPFARRTRRLARAQLDVALALGGAAGARLTGRQSMPTSRQTLLRLLRQMPLLAAAAPRDVGLDDWAKRKGHTYGTIVVDLETHDPIDLLDDRSAETVETWLKAHPTVEVVGRDRSETYAAGVTVGAPEAIQVADRWHIVKNLREAIEQELAQRRTPIDRSVSVDPPVTQAAAHAQSVIPPVRQPERPRGAPTTRAGHRAEAARQERRTARLAKYTQMVEMSNQGLDQSTIARRVRISDRTVTRWLAADGFPERKSRSGDRSRLDPYKATLVEQWQAGCHNATHLWRTIQGEGFAGGYELVATYLAPLRHGEAVNADPMHQPAVAAAPNPASYTARQAAFLFLRPPTALTASEQQDLRRMREQDATLATIYSLSQELAATVRERRPERLDGWLGGAATSDFPDIRRFANGIRRDYAAVRAALELPWNQGPVEGQITRLKLIKRQMYGRAKLDLLRRRVLHAA
jgi:transposase